MPTHAEHSLRRRFLWALLGVVALLVATFGIALGLFVNVFEHELLERVVTMELDEMPGRTTLPDGLQSGEWVAGMKHWTVPVADQQRLPGPLRDMPAGVGEVVWEDGSDMLAGKRINDGYIHAVVMDIGNVERLEQRLIRIGAGAAIIAFVLSLLLAARLSRTALRPISTLVERIRTLDPDNPGPPFAAGRHTTETREIAQALDGYQGRITQLLERERSLTDDISHELRTPTSVVATASELLLDDPTVLGAARERAGRIARAARRTISVVDALLFLGRGGTAAMPVRVDLRDIANDTVQMFRPLAEGKGLDLLVDCGGPQWISAPPETAAIVLRNLVENAIRFTDHGTVRVIVEQGRLIVEDTGIGLAGEDLGRIFERGYRSDTRGGSGLGLDLIRRICNRVGWRASAEQRPGGGSRFEVAFDSGAPGA